jgi:hypothetical protein
VFEEVIDDVVGLGVDHQLPDDAIVFDPDDDFRV